MKIFLNIAFDITAALLYFAAHFFDLWTTNKALRLGAVETGFMLGTVKFAPWKAHLASALLSIPMFLAMRYSAPAALFYAGIAGLVHGMAGWNNINVASKLANH